MSTSLYEIRIRGVIGSRTAAAFEGMEVRTETVLRGTLVDQAALHGVLDRVARSRPGAVGRDPAE